MAVGLHFPINPYLIERVVIFFNVHAKLGTWGCFLEKKRFIFLYHCSWNLLILYVLAEIFLQVSNLLLLCWGPRGAGRES